MLDNINYSYKENSPSYGHYGKISIDSAYTFANGEIQDFHQRRLDDPLKEKKFRTCSPET